MRLAQALSRALGSMSLAQFGSTVGKTVTGAHTFATSFAGSCCCESVMSTSLEGHRERCLVTKAAAPGKRYEPNHHEGK
jgi:hypothetical protein